MENTVLSCMNDFCKEIDQYFIDVKRQLFQIGINPNQHDMTGIIPLSALDDELDYRSHLDENVSRDDNVCLESDEDDYDSDCSLGSLNSLYLSLEDKYVKLLNLNKTNGVIKTQLEDQSSDKSKTARTSGNNLVARNHISISTAMFYDRIKEKTPTIKLNTSNYYGKQKSITQHRYSRRQLYARRLKKKYPSKIRKIRASAAVSKCKQNIYKLRTRRSLTKRKHRKRLINRNLIRYRLKERIPLLKINREPTKNIKQTIMKLTNAVEESQQNKIDFITDYETVSIEDLIQSLENTETKHELSESNNVLFLDFMDDFEDTQVFDDKIEKQ